MALGLTFLGEGRCSLNTTNESIAYLIVSLFPRFPMSTSDNRYHLQAVRHLYVLATEPRLLETRDISTNDMCFVPIQITSQGETIHRRAPCLLPEKIDLIRVETDIYCPKQLNKAPPSMILHVKKRAGYLNIGKTSKSLMNYSKINRQIDVDNLDGELKVYANTFEESRNQIYQTIEKDADVLFVQRLIEQTLVQPLDMNTMWNLKIMLTYYYYICKSRKERLLDGSFIEQVRIKLEKVCYIYIG